MDNLQIGEQKVEGMRLVHYISCLLQEGPRSLQEIPVTNPALNVSQCIY